MPSSTLLTTRGHDVAAAVGDGVALRAAVDEHRPDVADVGDFLAALLRIAAGETVLDPEVVTRMTATGRRADALDTLTSREREVLVMMADGRSKSTMPGFRVGSWEGRSTSLVGEIIR